ncbi:hypothetical protein FPOA_00817 [Fusarium poae]|uniref:Uncharacterized protein n=1 Tax=Fusarium poae TaxID=36050 RepID=A0A1B8B2A8_FUSPO|nr:hypothetical protein FPOA_00817 [Fusarium poae]
MRELTTLIPIGLFTLKVWVITGDINQRGPFITLEHDLGCDKVSSNPFAQQLTTSLLFNAVNSASTESYPRFNQRAQAPR